MDGVDTGSVGARVTASGASAGGAELGGRVGDEVAVAGAAAALEGVVETHPVTDLVGDGVAKVVVGGAAAGHRGVEDAAAILVEGVGAGRNGGGEVAVAEVAAQVLEEVDVERLIGALAERLLHGNLSAIRGPAGVDGEVGALEREGKPVRGVGALEDAELVVQHGGLSLC